MDTLEEAIKKVMAAISGADMPSERISVTDGAGRILAVDTAAEDDIPSFDKSTVDGYAVRAKDSYGASESIPAFFRIVEEIRMGEAPHKPVGAGEASYIPTGGMLPVGADAVVMTEHSELFSGNEAAVYEAVSPGRNVIRAGEDVKRGELLLPRGRKLKPQDIGALAAAGVSRIEVYKPWRITVISTGDEIIGPGEPAVAGKTRDINTYSISAAAERGGFEVVDSKVLKDDREKIKEAVRAAMAGSDVVAVSGGSSQGDRDYTAAIMDELTDGGVFTHGLALKPGKPAIFAWNEKSRTLLAGLPGHPQAALLVFELILARAYRQATGQSEPVGINAVITENTAAAGGRSTCVFVRLEDDGEGSYRAVPIPGGSGLITTLCRADGYVLTGINKEGLKEGETVKVTLF